MVGEGTRNVVVNVSANTAGFVAGMTTVRSQLTGLQSSMAGTFGTLSSGLASISNQMILTGAAGTGFSQYFTRMFGDAIPVVEEYYKAQAKLISINDELKNHQKDYNTVMQESFDAAKKWSESSIYSMTEITNAMYTISQAGYTWNETLKMTPQLMKLATAQGADLTMVVEDMIGVMNAYNIKADGAWKVTNLFAAAATASRVSLEDVHYGIKYITPTFSELGYSIEKAVTAWTMLTDLGYKGENAGRILRDSMNDLMNPTAEATDIIRKHNIELYTNQEEYNSLASTYDSMKSYVTDLTTQQKQLTSELAAQQDITEGLNLELQKLNLEAQKVRLKYNEDNPLLNKLEDEKDALVDARDAAKEYYNELKKQSDEEQTDIKRQGNNVTAIRRQLTAINSQMAYNRAQGYSNETPVQVGLAEDKKDLQDQLASEQSRLDDLKKTHNENNDLLKTQKQVISDASGKITEQNKAIKETKDKLTEAEQDEINAIDRKKIAIEEEKIAQQEKYQAIQDAQKKVNDELDIYKQKATEAQTALNNFVPEGLKDLRDILQEFKDADITLGEYGIIFGKQSASGFNKLVDAIGKYDTRLAELIKGEGVDMFDADGNYIGPEDQMGEAERQSQLVVNSPYGQWNIAGKQVGENSTLQAFQDNIGKITDTIQGLVTPDFVDDVEKIKSGLLSGVIKEIQNLTPTIQGATSKMGDLDTKIWESLGAFGAMTAAIMYVVTPALLTLGVFGSMASMPLGWAGKLLGGKGAAAIAGEIPTGASSLARSGMWLGDGAGGAVAVGSKYDKTLQAVGDVVRPKDNLPLALARSKYSTYDTGVAPSKFSTGSLDELGNLFVNGKLVSEVSKAEKPLAGIAKEMGAIEKAALTLTPALGIGAGEATAVGGISALGTESIIAGTSVAGVAGATGGLSGALATSIPLIGGASIALGPLLLIIAAVAIAVGGLWFAWKNNWGNIQGHAQNIYNWFTKTFSGLVTLFWNIKGEFDKTFGQLIENFQKVWDGLVNADLTELSEGLGGIVGTVLRILAMIPYYANQMVAKFVENLIQGIIDGGPGFIDALIAFLSDLPRIIDSAGQVLIYQASNFGANLVNSFLGIKVSDEDLRKQHENIAKIIDKGYSLIGKKSNLADYAANEDAKTAARHAKEALDKNTKSAADLGKTVASGIDSNKTNAEILADLGLSTDGVTKSNSDVGTKMDSYMGVNLDDYTDMFAKMDETNTKTQDTDTSLAGLNTTAATPLLAPNYDQNKFNAFNKEIDNSTQKLQNLQNTSANVGVPLAQTGNGTYVLPYAGASTPSTPTGVNTITPTQMETEWTANGSPVAPTQSTPNSNYVNPQDPVTGIGTYKDVFPDTAGTGFGSILASGLLWGINPVLGAASTIATTIAGFFPHSPAKTGPLTDLPVMGAEIATQLANGMNDESVLLEQSSNRLAEMIKQGLDVTDFVTVQTAQLTQYQETLQNALKQVQSIPSTTQNIVSDVIIGGETVKDGYITAPDGTKMKLQAPEAWDNSKPMVEPKPTAPVSTRPWYYDTQGANPVTNPNFNFTFNGAQNRDELKTFGKKLATKINNGRGNFKEMG